MINRRNFLSIGLGAVAVAMVPTSLSAVNFRDTKPKAWTTLNPLNGKKVNASDLSGIDASIKELFGTSVTTPGDINVKAPAIAENGAIVPITVSSSLKGDTVAIFQSANPEATTAVFTVPADGIINYSMRLKMAQTAEVRVVISVDGKLYSASKVVKVTKGGCGG